MGLHKQPTAEKGQKERISMSYLEIRAPFNKHKVESAEDLWSIFMSYLKHSDASPLVEPKLFNAKEGLREGELDKVRPYTLNGLCNHIGIHPQTWDYWKKREKENLAEDQPSSVFLDTMLQVESIIYDQQYQGAAVDIFNTSIVSRKLGLADKQELTGADGGPIKMEETSARERIAGKLAGLAARSDSPSDPSGPDGD